MAPESLSPLGEPRMAARRKRLSHLALMVFELMRERYQGGRITEFDRAESAGLIEALRVCSSFTEQIGCEDFGDFFVLRIEGIDGHNYIIRLTLFEPGFSLLAARVTVTSLTLPSGRENEGDSSFNKMDILEELSGRLKLNRVSVDRAFLVGMSLVIGFIDRQGEDEDERLGPLVQWITPSREELRELRGRLPAPIIALDDDVD